MKYTLAWANVLSQNSSLKAALLILSAVSITLAVTLAKVASRPPLLIERACFDRVLDLKSTAHSVSEIEAFIRVAIPQRFNSDAIPILEFLSQEELNTRTQEQKDLATRNMAQTVIVRSVKIDGNAATLESDRLISVGQIRSAFSFPVSITLTSTFRSEANPYGLQISQVSPQKQTSDKSEAK